MKAPDDHHMVAMNGVTKIYNHGTNEFPALNHVSFQAGAGELILLLGPSGSGKSTMLTLLAGLQGPTEGSIHLFGKNIRAYSPREMQTLRARKIGFIFQTFHLIDTLSVLENVMLVMRFAKMDRRESRDRAMCYLERFGIDRFAGASPVHLSQGEKQRVAVARALSADAKLIIGDEPTGSLASEQGMEIVRLISESVKTENRCAILASHDERISFFAHRVIRLRDGRIA